MKIEIKLEDPDSCEGCPFLLTDKFTWQYYCKKYNDIESRNAEEEGKRTDFFKRPKRCKEENGL